MTEKDEVVTEIAEHILPFGRRVRLLNVDYQNGLNMLRMIWREGRRITLVEIDPASAESLGTDILSWAKENSESTTN